ncbi:MAG: hypothetical protein NMK33_01560 [Candidatus Cardinium sp.]|uniref:hypothetical protein n=1 Tax=Cardinium endosymbiont of Dermatophagoides farinae TaxID=2597823 RepID=UPI0011827830|nr:hypothetical protein [Cardinium endosymbiont of Dermatophagoides farinae]TSJ81182.1 hypothetical protein FPG78_04235 [Cardinium endosymbiont of Dermatophagoides farinae]UWW97230.1 MAG: hypothetical protein NMK33_01560 [Candidatus Cardinium sp.]
MRIISSLLFMFCLPVAVTATEKRPSLATQLADHYLKSFAEAVQPVAPQAKQGSRVDVTNIHLSPRTERAVVFNEIFAKSDAYQAQCQEAGKLLNPYVWNDLNLFCGTTTTTPDYHFLSRINKTITVLGEVALASFISAPITNLETLTQRQRLIAFLCQNSQLYHDLRNELKNYRTSEKTMLSLWTETDPLYTKEYVKYLTNLFYTSSPASNKSASLLQTKKIWLRDIWNIYSNYIWYPVMGFLSTEIQYFFFKSEKKSHSDHYKGFGTWIPIYNFFHTKLMICLMKQKKTGNRSLLKISTRSIPLMPFILSIRFTNTIEDMPTTKSMQAF